MKILIAVTRFPPDFAGGAERRFHAMALAAQRLGHEVEVLATNAYAKFPSEPVDGIPVRRLDWPAGVDSASWEAATYVADLLRGDKPPDVVWTGNAAMGLAVGHAWPDVPVIFSPGEMRPLGWRSRLVRAWERWRHEGFRTSRTWWRREAVVDELVRRAWTTALPSQQNVDYVSLGRPASWPRLRVLPRGVDVKRWMPARAARQPSPDGMLRILVACRLVPRKNVEHAIEALARCRVRAIRLQISGDGPHEGRLRELAVQRGVAERVEFMGMCADMLAVYAGTDVFVMSSHFDPYPNTVSEAMASGCPVIVRWPSPPRSSPIGIHEMVDGTPGCLTYDTEDVEELARHLDMLAEDRARLNAMSQSAANWAGARDWSRIVPEYFPNGRGAEGKA